MNDLGTVFITGATGFVGACLVRSLVARGVEVHVLVRPSSNLWRLETIRDQIILHEGDVMESETLRVIVERVTPRTVFHLAAYGAYPTKQTNSVSIMQTNLIGTMNLVQVCQKINYRAFINAGSSSEYGVKNKPMSESDLLEPYNDYGVAKAAASLFCQNIGRAQRRPMVTLRLFSVYGPYEESFRLMPSIVTACIDRVPIRLSHPHPVRDFIHVEDVVTAYLRCAERAAEFPGEILNIGTGTQHSVGEVVDIMKKVDSQCPPVVWGSIDNPRTEPEIWRANMEKTKSMLKWEPSISLEQGLKQTYEWFWTHRSLYP